MRVNSEWLNKVIDENKYVSNEVIYQEDGRLVWQVVISCDEGLFATVYDTNYKGKNRKFYDAEMYKVVPKTVVKYVRAWKEKE